MSSLNLSPNYAIIIIHALVYFLVRRQRRAYLKHYLPWALENGKRTKPLMPVYWEKRWEQNIHELRSELGITVLNKA